MDTTVMVLAIVMVTSIVAALIAFVVLPYFDDGNTDLNKKLTAADFIDDVNSVNKSGYVYDQHQDVRLKKIEDHVNITDAAGDGPVDAASDIFGYLLDNVQYDLPTGEGELPTLSFGPFNTDFQKVCFMNNCLSFDNDDIGDTLSPITATAPVLGTVTASRASQGSTSVVATWSGFTGATAYDVYYNLSSSTYDQASLIAANLTATASPYTFVRVFSPGTVYYVHVVAKNAAGSVFKSILVADPVAGTPGTPAPVAPIATSAAVTVSAAGTVSWLGFTGTVTSYAVYYSTSPVYAATAILASENIAMTASTFPIVAPVGTLPGAYYAHVVAKNGTLSASKSSTTTFTIAAASAPATPAPVAPIATSATVTVTTAGNVSWTGFTGTVTSYAVYYSTSQVYAATAILASENLAMSASTFAIVPPASTPAGAYYAHVVAKNGTLSASKSSTTTFTVAAPLAAAPVLAATATALTTTVVGTSMTVAWADGFTGTSATTRYDVFYSTVPALSIATDTKPGVDLAVTSYMIAGLAPGSYYVHVVAKNGAVSVTKSSATPVPIAATLAPVNPTVTAARVVGTSTSIKVDWSGFAVGSTYDVYYSIAPTLSTATDSKPGADLAATLATYTITGLLATTPYYVHVIAKKDGISTAPVSATVAAETFAVEQFTAWPGSLGMYPL